jgi:hypothetical protein
MTLRNNILNKALDHRPCGLFVGGGDVKDTVGVNVEGDLDLRDTAGSRGDAGEFEFAEEVVVLRARTLTPVHLDKHTGLVVGVGGEGLGLLRGDSGVALDESGHDTTNGLDTEGQGSDVEEEVLGLLRGVAREDGGLEGGTVGDGLVGLMLLLGSLPLKKSDTSLTIRGIRVEPPTRTIW